MSHVRRGMIAVALTALVCAQSLAQGPIRVSTVSSPVNSLSVADIDFLNATTPKLLFSITITNTSGTPLPAVMIVTIDALLAGEKGDFPRALTLTTRAFVLGPSLTVTNLDIGAGRTLHDSLYEKDQAAIDHIKQIALPSGTLPAGTYHFSVVVRQLDEVGEGIGEFSLVLTNPTSVDLLSPLDGEPGMSPLPLFQWMFDGYRSRLKVFEKLPWQASVEEAASGVPYLVAETSARSYAYPSSGVRTLEPGKTYVWYVEGLVAVSGGADQVITSPIRSFTVASTGEAGLQSLLDELERTLDPKYKSLIDELRSEGMSPSGTIRVDGAPITLSEFLKLLSQLRIRPAGVDNVTIEE